MPCWKTAYDCRNNIYRISEFAFYEPDFAISMSYFLFAHFDDFLSNVNIAVGLEKPSDYRPHILQSLLGGDACRVAVRLQTRIVSIDLRGRWVG